MDHIRTAYDPVKRSWNDGAHLKASAQAVLTTVGSVAFLVGQVAMPVIGLVGGGLLGSSLCIGKLSGIGFIFGACVGLPIGLLAGIAVSALGVGMMKLAGNREVTWAAAKPQFCAVVNDIFAGIFERLLPTNRVPYRSINA